MRRPRRWPGPIRTGDLSTTEVLALLRKQENLTPAQFRRVKCLLELQPSRAALDRIANAVISGRQLSREPERILVNILRKQTVIKRRLARGINRPHPPYTEAHHTARIMLSACDPNMILMLHRRIDVRLAAIYQARGGV